MIPSVLTLLGFTAGTGTAPSTASGVAPFPFGFLGGASETTLESAVSDWLIRFGRRAKSRGGVRA